MSVTTITPYYPFRRINIIDQSITAQGSAAQIRMQPDNRFTPICHECDHRASGIHTGKLEGVNNKIKVIKRKAYGFLDTRDFTLKIYQAFSH